MWFVLLGFFYFTNVTNVESSYLILGSIEAYTYTFTFPILVSMQLAIRLSLSWSLSCHWCGSFLLYFFALVLFPAFVSWLIVPLWRQEHLEENGKPWDALLECINGDSGDGEPMYFGQPLIIDSYPWLPNVRERASWFCFQFSEGLGLVVNINLELGLSLCLPKVRR